MIRLLMALVMMLAMAAPSVAQTTRAAAAGPTEPAVSLASRRIGMPKPVFVSVSWDPADASWQSLPPGCLPAVVEGGGRFDGNPPGRNSPRDSFWVGGYYGIGGGPNAKPTGEFREHVDPAKVRSAMAGYPPGTFYILNIEHYPTNVTRVGDAAVEDSIRKFRAFLAAARSARPDMRFAVWAVAPESNYNVTTRYLNGLDAYARWQRGEPLDASDLYNLRNVAVQLADKRWLLNDEQPIAAEWRKLRAANDRLTFGRDAAGRADPDAGLTRAVDALVPSAYDHVAGDEGNDARHYIEGGVAEARRIGDGLPVLVCLHGSYVGPLLGKPIPPDEWRVSVRRALAVADGLLLWQTTDAEQIRIALEEAAAH